MQHSFIREITNIKKLLFLLQLFCPNKRALNMLTVAPLQKKVGPKNDTKLSDGEAPIQVFLGVWSTPSLSLVSSPCWSGHTC